jgi:hypothetical protein
MHTSGSLSQQVEAYHGWKKELIRQIARYRLWLQDNDLFSDDVSHRIRRGLELADNMHRQIRKPAPTLIQQKVVNLSGIA